MSKEETVKYLNIMIESLQKKQGMYESLLQKTNQQSECIDGKDYESANWSQFEVLIIEKDSIIGKVDELDIGFDKVYDRVKKELDSNKDAYKDQIKELQKLITVLTDLGVRISTSEERNRQDIDRIMTAAKAGIGKARRNMKVTSGYIASMYGGGISPDSTKIDSKN